MAVIGLQSSIWSNRLKTIYLLILFPLFLFGLFYAVFFAMNYNSAVEFSQVLDSTNKIFLQVISVLTPVLFVRMLISFFFYRQIIFKFSGAKAITRKENPEIYNIVENLCISRGLPTPNIGILEDDSMNAFATGLSEKSAWIVFSRGLLNRLDKREIEAVAAHELTHIINRDSLLMVVIIVIIGAVATIGEIVFRWGLYSRPNSDSKDNSKALLIMIGLVLMFLGYLIFPLVRLAISRKREYLADAGAVELTSDNRAMISALEKISTDAQIESIKKNTVAALCIEDPKSKKEKRSFIGNLFSTHPSVPDRIEALKKY
ncbi:MAG: M48 family metallopeptidase [Candidatus Gracilibacteria bacterium]|nr:M48 family metallopeptidase [Candidatus Gracilibacteria bacterium]